MVVPADLAGADTRVLYSAVVGAVMLERLLELRIANRNTARALAEGGREHGAGHYPVMVVLHTTFLLACLAEVWWLDRPWIAALGLPCAAALCGTMALRYWVVATLGPRWTTRVICVPGAPAITGGPYRFHRHPNYVAVVVEIAALALMHTAWLTAAVYSIANALLLRTRIRVEERALREHGAYGT